jgi:integrase
MVCGFPISTENFKATCDQTKRNEAGVGVKEIQQRLGHTDINTTMNIYAHMTANMEEKAFHQFSKLMKDLL